jgi:hypothetical protein
MALYRAPRVFEQVFNLENYVDVSSLPRRMRISSFRFRKESNETLEKPVQKETLVQLDLPDRKDLER